MRRQRDFVVFRVRFLWRFLRRAGCVSMVVSRRFYFRLSLKGLRRCAMQTATRIAPDETRLFFFFYTETRSNQQTNRVGSRFLLLSEMLFPQRPFGIVFLFNFSIRRPSGCRASPFRRPKVFFLLLLYFYYYYFF